MSSLWQELKQGWEDGGKQAKTSNAIRDIENKKAAISQASQNEQDAIKAKISEEFRKIGETSYALHMEGTFEIEKLNDMFETIKNYYQTLDEKQVKLCEILSRYDEELEILRPAPPAGQYACKNCGTEYTPGEMLFCRKCGNKLDAVEAQTGEPAAEPTPKPVCAKCNTTNISAAVFCSNCGSQL